MKVATVFEFIISAMDTRVRSMRRMEKKSSVITDPVGIAQKRTMPQFSLNSPNFDRTRRLGFHHCESVSTLIPSRCPGKNTPRVWV
eukprot:1315080-Amorphochlora_amoeboformis.AAC.1